MCWWQYKREDYLEEKKEKKNSRVSGEAENRAGDGGSDDGVSDDVGDENGGGGVVSLTLEHIQGIFLILALGYVASSLMFLVEFIFCRPL